MSNFNFLNMYEHFNKISRLYKNSILKHPKVKIFFKNLMK